MGTKINVRYVVLMVAVMCCTSCGLFSFLDPEKDIPRSEYYLQGDSSLTPNQVSEVSDTVLDFLNDELGQIKLYMGLFKRGGISSSETYRITEGSLGYGQHDFIRLSGSFATQGDILSFNISKDPRISPSTPITMVGECSHSDAQQAITEVRSPKWGNNTSGTAVTIHWTISGIHNGEEFSLDCTQTFLGKSQSWIDPAF